MAAKKSPQKNAKKLASKSRSRDQKTGTSKAPAKKTKAVAKKTVASSLPKRPRLKKSVAARAVARVEAELAAAEEKKRAAKKEAKERELALVRRKREKERARAAKKKAVERARKAAQKAAERERAALIRDEARREEAAEKQAARLAKQEKREQEAAEKQAARLAKQEHLARVKEERARKREQEAAEKQAARLAKQEKREQAKAAAALSRRATQEQRARERRLEGRCRAAAKVQSKAWGAPLHELIALQFQALAQRPDLNVQVHLGPPTPLHQIAEADLDDEQLLWASHAGPLELTWCHTASPHDPVTFSTSSSPELALLAARARQWFTTDDASDSLALQGLMNEAAPLGTPLEEIVDHLRPLLPGEPEQTELSLRRLCAWLQDEARLLVHRDATKEGQRRSALMREASGRFHPGECDRLLISELNRGPALSQASFNGLFRMHEAFLRQGGGGGAWTVRAESGCVLADYERSPFVRGQLNLSLLNLSNLKLDGLDLSWTNLAGCRADGRSFNKGSLRGAVLAQASLERTKFVGCDLRDCDFTGARLRGADFRKADLTRTNFETADLTGAHFAGAHTSGTRFGGANVRNIKY